MRSIRIVLQLCLSISILASAKAADVSIACKPVPKVATLNYDAYVVSSSGAYCLERDIQISNPSVIDTFLSGGHGRTRPSFGIKIEGDDVTIDLNGHAVIAGDESSGMLLNDNPVPVKNITIRDGTIKAATNVGVVANSIDAVTMADFGDPFRNVSASSAKTQADRDEWLKTFDMLQRDKLRVFGAVRAKTSAGDLQRNIHLERLRIFAHGGDRVPDASPGAVTILGAGTVIRDCVIETDAGTAIWIIGPNALIENNTIIVHGTNEQRDPDSAIRLIDADGTVIRNNKIVIKGSAHHRAISTFDTGAFTVDNNTFYGLTKEDTLAKAFTGELKMQATNSHFEPAFKGLFLSD